MARNIRVVDSFEPSGIRDVESYGRGPYRRRWAGREPLVVILVLALGVVWVYRNLDTKYFEYPISIDTPSIGSAPSVDIGTAPVTPPETSIGSHETAIVSQPVVTLGASYEQQSDIMGYARVLADSLNLRAGPGFQHYVISALPGNSEVAVLRQLDIDPDGVAWVEVLGETHQGWRRGWVMRLHLGSCNCPTY
jgi:hypothetical protein